MMFARFLLLGFLFGWTAEGAPADCFRRLADDVCTVTSVVTDGNLKVEFTLRPEKGSNIRCRMELPPAGRWDGRMWGVGNSGTAGRDGEPRVLRYAREAPPRPALHHADT